jgi:hypothetical protein
MTQRWQAAGWLCVGLAVVFAVVSLVLAFQGTAPAPVAVDRIAIVPSLATPTGLLRSIVFGVLAGVAFFTALTCFFWSAVVEARQQRTRIIELLSRT